ATVRTRARVLEATGAAVVLRDELTGAQVRVAARAVVNATGVWADTVVDGVRLRPSRGTPIVLRAAALPGLTTAPTVPVPGRTTRCVFALPEPDGLVYVGLTDEPMDGPPLDVPAPTEPEIGFLLDVVAAVLDRP